MKEVTDWNGKPRWMWCWDDNEHDRCKEYVVCILTEEEMKKGGANYPVCTYDLNYKHCAEIEKETKKETRLTMYELSQLVKCFGVDYAFGNNVGCNNTVAPIIEQENDELADGYKIRYKQGEWEEPTRETIWKWWCRESSNSDIAMFVSFFGWGKDNKEQKDEE